MKQDGRSTLPFSFSAREKLASLKICRFWAARPRHSCFKPKRRTSVRQFRAREQVKRKDERTSMNSSLRGSETCWSSSLEIKSSCSWGEGIMAGWERKRRFNVSSAPSGDRDVLLTDLGLFSVRVGALRWHEPKVLLHELQDKHRVCVSLAPLATPEERGERTWCRSCLANRAARYGFESILQSTMSVSSICSRMLSRCQHPVRRTVADN